MKYLQSEKLSEKDIHYLIITIFNNNNAFTQRVLDDMDFSVGKHNA